MLFKIGDKMKKAQGLSLNMIIIAALALIILIVIVLIFSGKVGTTSKGISEVQDSVNLEKCNIPGVRKCVDSGYCSAELSQYSASCDSPQICCGIGDITG